MFDRAESLLLDKNSYDQAVSLFDNILEQYPESEYSVKALYTQGWIFENRLNNPDSALSIYKKLADKYPKSEYAVESYHKNQEARKKAIADSIAALENKTTDTSIASVPDSTKSVTSDSTLSVVADTALIHTQIDPDSTKQTEKPDRELKLKNEIPR